MPSSPCVRGCRIDRAPQKILRADGLTTWIIIPTSASGLLRNQIQSGIRDSRVLVLVWSESAFQSRWVMPRCSLPFASAGYHSVRRGQDTLAQFLGNAAYLSCKATRTASDNACAGRCERHLSAE